MQFLPVYQRFVRRRAPYTGRAASVKGGWALSGGGNSCVLRSLLNICNALRVLSACRSSCPTTCLRMPAAPVSATTLPHPLPSTLSPAIVSRMQRLKIKCRRITKQAASLAPSPVASCKLPVVSWQLCVGSCILGHRIVARRGRQQRRLVENPSVHVKCMRRQARRATCEIYAHTYVECISGRRRTTPTTRPLPVLHARALLQLHVSPPSPSSLGQLIKIHEKSSKARINFGRRKNCAKGMRKEIWKWNCWKIATATAMAMAMAVAMTICRRASKTIKRIKWAGKCIRLGRQRSYSSSSPSLSLFRFLLLSLLACS